MIRTLCAALACAAVLLLGAPAQATSCRGQTLDEAEAKRMFGDAEAVFVGHLEKVGKATDQHHGTGQGLDTVISTSDIDLAPATFRVRNSYKAAAGVAIEVYVPPGLARGRDYLVFADHATGYSGRPDGEMAAGYACARRVFDVRDRDTVPLLAYLDALPPEGSGGELHVWLGEQPQHKPVSDAALEFRRTDGTGTVSLRTDADGVAAASKVPAGTYRLSTAPPAGFRYNCARWSPGYEACDGLLVHDRGLDQFGVVQEPNAALKVRIVDAAGHAADVVAQFDLFEPGSGKRIGTLTRSSFDTGCSNHECAASGRLQPGRVVIGLVLPHIRHETDVTRLELDGAASVVFDNGASADAAPALDLHTGDNEQIFHLPPALTPVRSVVAKVAGDPYVVVNLLCEKEGPPPSRYVASASTPFSASGARTFWSIPGQTFSISTYANGKIYTTIAHPLADGELKVAIDR